MRFLLLESRTEQANPAGPMYTNVVDEIEGDDAVDAVKRDIAAQEFTVQEQHDTTIASFGRASDVLCLLRTDSPNPDNPEVYLVEVSFDPEVSTEEAIVEFAAVPQARHLVTA